LTTTSTARYIQKETDHVLHQDSVIANATKY
jgi:hypothetical protein